MELRKLGLERYKGYAEPVEVEIAPLTILVGANNSGKTALAQAIQLLAGGLAVSGRDTSEPIPLDSGGLQHGATFEDLVTRRKAHGQLPADGVLVYWVDAEPERGSVLRKIRIDDKGDIDDWPEGVFIEAYEEVLAIRRAGRSTG